jgi:hypothetical protein
MKKSLQIVFVVCTVTAILALALFDAEARGRKGSHRAYPGHGKGSHYVGGK